ncbi:MAG: stage V sporulation protein AC [Clostridiaceae bacterium]|nr:stage V sporulation protein AC [Clostridiaceae bacterium]MDY5991900.1 stage V sporulation protein AC [Oscillospiraceae bacterium]
MSVSKEEYSNMAKRFSPSSPILLDCLKAFLIGGLICCFAELLTSLFSKTQMTLEEVKALVLVVIIALTAILTGFGVFDNIAKHAGAGTAVPITGFANSIVSPAMEFHSEGFILGTAANMFKLAGPVIVFGCGSAVVYGLIIYIFGWY